MTLSVCDHVVYVDDRGSYATLHLTLECSRAGVARSHDVNDDHCAAALDDWLRMNPERALLDMTRLRRLVLRDDALDPAVVSVLGASSFPQLESLELWLGRFEYGWDGSAQDLVPLLNSPGFGKLRQLVLVSDLSDGLVDVL